MELEHSSCTNENSKGASSPVLTGATKIWNMSINQSPARTVVRRLQSGEDICVGGPCLFNIKPVR